MTRSPTSSPTDLATSFPGAIESARIVAPGETAVDRAVATETLRPQRLIDFVGQGPELANLKIFIEAAKRRGDALKHVLFCGPPGLGKTTLARIVAGEMGTELYSTSGPAIAHKGDLGGMLSQLEPRSIFFIDEIHRLSPAVEETLYTAMEDGFFDMPIGQGVGAKVFRLDLAPFTLIGATTRQGLLTKPFLSRFGHVMQMTYYRVEELDLIVRRAAGILGLPITSDGSFEIARRSRGTPRIANRLLHSVRDFAEVEGNGQVTRDLADHALTSLGVDRAGLDDLDRRFLAVVIERYSGGPVGLDAVAAAMGEEAETLESVYEPFLVQEGFLLRTPRGRTATPRAYDHLGHKAPIARTGQAGLF